jgi:UDP-N-acetylglucosamine--N-acetylmuramyl-(pentapeptide) pyrophosphoryl-undecaprenol N-acetylglucosamine transferase
VSRTFAVVTGGGTSGHVLPAIAVAEALVAKGHDPDTILYVGARRGIETRLLPDTPFPHVFLDVVGFQRSLSARNIGFAPKMLLATRRAIAMFRSDRPSVVVSVGGYASLPSVFAARVLRIPIVVVSYDLLPGRASQIAAKRAAASAVAFPDSPLPRATVTGAPVRQAILNIDRRRDRAAARHELGLPPDRFVVAVMGGSQGSGVLNDAVVVLLDERAGDASLAVRHVVGERFIENAPPATDDRHGVVYQPIGYEEKMPLVYAAADVLVGRGGASTVHEVAVTGIPAVLVPWAGSAEDHQTHNVRWLSDVGAAIHLPESSIERLPEILRDLQTDHPHRAQLTAKALELGETHRHGAIAELIEAVAAGTG